MLLRFRVKNYRSFAGEAELDMGAAKGLGNAGALLCEEGVWALPVAAVFGANASGKSNLLDAVGELRGVGKGGIEETQPYLLDEESAGKPAEFEVCVGIKGTEWRYGFAAAGGVVKEEWLYSRPMGSAAVADGGKHGAPAQAQRSGLRGEEDDKASERTVSAEREAGVGEPLEDEEEEVFYRSEADRPAGGRSFDCAQDDKGMGELPPELTEAFRGITCLNYAGDGVESALLREAGKLLYHDDTLQSELTAQLALFDPAIHGIAVLEHDNGGVPRYEIRTVHRAGSVEKEFPLSFESGGMVKIIGLLTFVLIAMRRGGILLCDEMDIKLHPLALRQIVAMFHDKTLNRTGAQLIFTAHNISGLDGGDLRPDEVWFVEKRGQESELYSLYDFKGNYEDGYAADYLAGRFGAVPFLED